ncbi:MAG: secretin N-terminal domain-containing protein [Planctomycetaceae bacterium]
MTRLRTFTFWFLLSALASAVPVCGQTTADGLRSWNLQHTQPSDVRRMLTELLGENSGGARIFADDQQRQLVVTGPASVQQLADQLVRQVDRPPAADVTMNTAREVKTYFVPPSELDQQVRRLQTQLGTRVRIAVDRDRSQLIVAAAAADHVLLDQMLSSREPQPFRPFARPDVAPFVNTVPATSSSGANTLFPPSLQSTLVPGTRSAQFRLRNITPTQCRQALRRLLADNISEGRNGELLWSTADGSNVSLEFQNDSRTCTVTGDARVVEQVSVLIQSFEDSQSGRQDETFRFIPLRKTRPEVVERAIRTWKEAESRQRSSDTSQGRLFERTPVRPVGFTQETADEQPAETVPDNGLPQTNGQPQENSVNQDLRRPSSDVTIQPLPDLDVLILRGRDPDVDELLRIIQEIERLSDETAPEIEIYPLRHTQGEALDELIQQVLDELTGPLQGRVSITPLVKPNALLLIGWGEAVNAAKKLIARLDRPIAAETQMQVFPLKYASAATISRTIEQFLNGRGGLGPNINVATDLRTNSLIVNASPRDMDEVTLLIRRLDVDSSAAVNQAKLIRLKNAWPTTFRRRSLRQSPPRAVAAATGVRPPCRCC